MVARSGIDTFLYLLDDAFRGAGIAESNESQALLTNIATVPPDRWEALAAGAARSIRDIASHVGACKVMYDDYTFGSGTLQFGTPEVEPFAGGGSPADVIEWLEAAHTRLVAHVAALPGDELGRATADPLDHRGDDHPRRLPRRRDQPHPEPARRRRPMALSTARIRLSRTRHRPSGPWNARRSNERRSGRDRRRKGVSGPSGTPGDPNGERDPLSGPTGPFRPPVGTLGVPGPLGARRTAPLVTAAGTTSERAADLGPALATCHGSRDNERTRPTRTT